MVNMITLNNLSSVHLDISRLIHAFLSRLSTDPQFRCTAQANRQSRSSLRHTIAPHIPCPRPPLSDAGHDYPAARCSLGLGDGLHRPSRLGGGEQFGLSGPIHMPVLCTRACKLAAVSGVASNMPTSRLKGKGDRGSICTDWKGASRLANITWHRVGNLVGKFGWQVGDADTYIPDAFTSNRFTLLGPLLQRGGP